ncbi:site-specific recombinase XerD [Nitrosospira sp. Nsp2]|uniref:tyrosine-type recombinase/integrase n=1 Tax=Nitrosospira sp. Nsp2 TaxID=136548 RepID=UPI000D30CA46|nr:site-specific integrase [Nitrosospira sp. Nsp2]PTR14454.1 site-specific recombinase XerD [Nitrosospira sp. Nsp2]
MGKLNDMQIRNWIKAGERFDMRSDGDGLYLSYRENFAIPVWRLRYSFVGKPRIMNMGSYRDLSIADARKKAKELRARVALGYDVAGEKQQRKVESLAKIESDKNAYTVAQLADEYFERMILGRWKHPNIVRARIERDIKPAIGNLRVEDVKPRHIDDILKAVIKRGAPSIANDVLRWLKRMFNYAVKRHVIEYNPAAAFDPGDAGGKEKSRDRWLNGAELEKFFAAMRDAKGFSVENYLTIKLLLLLAVRKSELITARWDEFDLDKGVWYLPAERTKTGVAMDIPLPSVAVDWLRELERFACGSEWILPARKAQDRMLPHISDSTLSVALAKVKHGLAPFTIHDLRRTARTHLEALGVPPHIAERCLNHKIKGVEGIYNRHDYFKEREAALNAWAALLLQFEKGGAKVVPIKRSKTVA